MTAVIVPPIELIAGPPGAPATLFDELKRQITYLRISVTDRCNFRCVCCMPAEGLPRDANDDVLSFDEIVPVVDATASVGIWSIISLSGGEPLIRPRLVDFVVTFTEAERRHLELGEPVSTMRAFSEVGG